MNYLVLILRAIYENPAALKCQQMKRQENIGDLLLNHALTTYVTN